jgi:Fe2+ transport system protein FeoA
MATTSVSSEPILLGFLGAGCTAVVDSVLGISAHAQRLREMGLRDGARVQMIQPGNPCLIRLGDQRLGFRGADLMSVLVRPEA